MSAARTDCLPAFPKVSVDTVTTVEGVAALRPEYERLRLGTGCTLPFSLHEWHLTWCRHFLDCNPHIRDEPLFYILRNYSGACVAILPFIVSRRRLGPLKVVSVSLLGADPAITEIRVPMIQSGYELPTARAARDQLAKVSDWDWIHWSGVSSEFAEALSADGTLRWQSPLSDFVLDLPDTWEGFRSRAQAQHSRVAAALLQLAKRDGHRFELQVDRRVPRGVLAGSGAVSRTAPPARKPRQHGRLIRTALRVRFAATSFDAVSERLAARGAVLPVWAQGWGQDRRHAVGLRGRRELVFVLLGIRSRLGALQRHDHHGRGSDQVRDRQGLKTVNLSPAKDLSKSRWGPRQIDYPSAYEPQRTPAVAFGEQRLLAARSETGYPSKLLQRLITIPPHLELIRPPPARKRRAAADRVPRNRTAAGSASCEAATLQMLEKIDLDAPREFRLPFLQHALHHQALHVGLRAA